MTGKIMAIAAHPGDGMFTMGATLAKQIERGGKGVLLSLSLGEKGAPKNIPVKQYGEMQRAATEKSVRLLGAEAVFLTYPDAEIPFNEESSLAVCDVIREHMPDIIVTHWNGSWHKDHQNCHLIVHDAIFYAALGTLERKLPPHSAGRSSEILFCDTICPPFAIDSARTLVHAGSAPNASHAFSRSARLANGMK